MEEIMKQLAESLRKAKESGKFTAEHVKEIVRETMTEACKSVKGDEERLRKITGGSIIASVEELENQGNATEEMITAAVEGAVDSVKAAFQEAVEGMEAELEQIELRLREEEEKKAAGLRAVLEGAGENAGAFTGEVKEQIETAVTDAKLKNALILGLTRETVKQAVKQAIETGEDVEETVTNITRDATLKALAEVRFRSGKVKEVSNIVLSGATEAAEEAGSYVREVVQGAVKGTREGVRTVSGAGKAVQVVAEEAKELGKRALYAAKGALSGMWKGARDGLKKGGNQ